MAYTLEFVENVVTLTQTLGVILFRPLLKINPKEARSMLLLRSMGEWISWIQLVIPPKCRFDFVQQNIPAEMITDGKDFVILKGSKARPDSAGIPPGIKQMRTAARKANILISEPNSSLEVFQADYPTTSVSAAGAMVYGSSCQGPKAWRHIGTGQLYSEWVKGTASLVHSTVAGEITE